MSSSSSISARLSPIHQISQIRDHLFLSGIAVIKPDPITKSNITTIINATTEENTPHVKGVEMIRIRVDDHPSANLGLHFHTIADKIKSVRDGGGKVLVHCMAGVSRSASLVLAYLVKHERMTLRQAYYYVKSCRPIINPNLGFWKQLVDFERRLRGSPTVTLVPSRLSPYPIPDVYSDLLSKEERASASSSSTSSSSVPRRPPPFSSLSTTSTSSPSSSSPLSSLSLLSKSTLSALSPSTIASLSSRHSSPLSSTSYRTSTLTPSRSRVIPISSSTPSSLSTRFTPRFSTVSHF